MAARRRTRAREAYLAFEAIAIEGGLLSPDWLSKIAQLQAESQSESDYRIPKGLNLRDEIGRYWRIAQAHWNEFENGRKASGDARRLAETFVPSLLREAFGFASLAKVGPAVIAERSYPIGHAALAGRVPVIVASTGKGVDALGPELGDGTRRRSAFGLVQEFLNAQDGALWGVASDGVVLRIARDNASLTRPAWIEADLARIFTEERYADFAALWLLLHETRFGRDGQQSSDCPLEQWRNAGRKDGTRAREFLREGVKEALIALGQGFLAHPSNGELRANLQSGALTTKDYFNQLLRLVYRMIFLLTVEERGLLHPPGKNDEEVSLYGAGYSMRRLRERSVRRNAHDRFSDLWEAARIAFRGLASGESRLGLPALAGIFAKTQCPSLDAAKLENRWLLLAMFKLAWLREDGALARVNWRDMGPEELGSVYESLLELVPQITQDGRQFAFATGGETKGNARKTTGSYYTPDSLVQVLLDSALEPVIADTIAKQPSDSIEALLGLSIVDPACGSGHFLLAAARRLAAHVARLQANGTPSAAEYRHALREVVGRSIYGVDLNPMAVELCKVSLWMEAVEPGLPLTFLDAHIQQGNALLGTTPDMMARSIPDRAWEPIEGDDKKIASALKKRNKAEAGGQRTLYTMNNHAEEERKVVANAVADLEAASDSSAEALAHKESQWERILASTEYRHQKFVADSWCAAFVWPKKPDDLYWAAPTNETWRQIRDAEREPPPLTVRTVHYLAAQYAFFHWHLQFPQVFANGGFDVVLGNPPWERVKLQEQEFFASRSEEIAHAKNAAARKELIAQLSKQFPQLWDEWCDASREADGESHFVRQSGRYPLCGKGDVNTYALFAEHNRAVLRSRGRAGFIVPTGIATDDTTKKYFSLLVDAAELQSLFDFQTGPETFGNLAHGALRFCLMTIAPALPAQAVDLVFLAKSTTDLNDAYRHFQLSRDDFRLLNPNTRTCPTFMSQRDADINRALYQRSGILWLDDDGRERNPWDVTFLRMFDMANDSARFRGRAELANGGATLEGNRFISPSGKFVPLVEAKMVDHFDHRYASLIGVDAGSGRTTRKLVGWYSAVGTDPTELAQPQYWLAEEVAEARLRGRWTRGWLLGWRDICRSTDQRTVIASLIPRVATGDTFLIAMPNVEPTLSACLYACLCSFVLDYAARQKVGGTHLKYHVFKQLPIPAPGVFDSDRSWQQEQSIRDWLVPRVLELTYTAWDLEPFANDVGYLGPPFRWDTERRFLLRCELDAAFFHLYGISRDDVDYIMDTFPIVRKNDEKAYGEYRTKRMILEIYDAMAEAARSGTPHQTRLDPPPADPRVAHPENSRPDWAKTS